MTKILANNLLSIFEKACGKQLQKEVTWISIKLPIKIIIINNINVINELHFHYLCINDKFLYVCNDVGNIIKTWYCPILCHYLNKVTKRKLIFQIERKNK